MQISLWDPGFISFGFLSRNEIAESYGSSIFKFWRGTHTFFHRDYTSLHSHQQWTCALFPHTLANNCYCSSLDNSHPNRCDVIAHCGVHLLFPMISDVEHLFIYLMAICMFSFKRCLFKSLAYFLNQFVFLLLSCFYYILDIKALSDIWYANIFSYFVGCLFILFTVSFAMQNFFF